MKAIIADISELSDSRQLMESKPIPAFTWFVYILLAFITTALVWSYFGTIDEYISVNGAVRPVSQIQTVQMPFSGKIDKMYVTEGQKVKKGDILFSADTKDVEQQKQLIEKQIDLLTDEQKNLQKLRECVVAQKNTFNENSADENAYYVKCQKYLTDVAAAQVTIANGNVDKKQSKADLEASITSFNRQITKQNQTISDLQTLIDSISANTNKFSDSSSIYAQKYRSYKSKLDSLEENAKQDLQRETLVSLNTEMTAQKNSLAQLMEAKTKVENAVSAFDSKSDGNGLSLKNLELTMLVQTDEAIASNKSTLLSLNEKIGPYAISMNKATVKADTDGIVNFAVNADVNNAVEQNANIIHIIPQNSERKVTLTVPESSISKVKKNQRVKIQINSLDYSDYGYAAGTVDKISSDVQYDKNNRQGCYLVEAKVSQAKLKKQNGSAEEIKVGMSCNAKIISGQKKILFWLLEKLDFLH